jgi:hypothetical protein
MSEVKVNKISPRTACGTTTLGDSGDTFNVPCGSKINLASGGNLTVASGATITNNGTQTGFGRTGTVDWITTPKVTGDSPITGVTGKGYFLDTTSGTITLNLPAGAAGSIVSMADYARTWQTNNVTIAANGSEKIGASEEDATLSTEGQSVTFVYVDSTQGWLNVQDSTSNITGATFVAATVSGACNTLVTAPCCANTKIATFLGPGTFCVSAAAGPTSPYNVVSHLVIAGGGGGGGSTSDGIGAGGAGGYREVKSPSATGYTASPLDGYSCAPNRVTVSVAPYAITVGGGGAGSTGPSGSAKCGSKGGNSIFSGVTSAGGGGGASDTACSGPTRDGGSGGGSKASNTAGVGNTPPTTPAQGFSGAVGLSASPYYTGGGGGGASEAGQTGPGSCGGRGGAGTPTTISSSATAYAGGGGGGVVTPGGSPTGQDGGTSPCGTGGSGGGPTGPGKQAGTGDINTGGGGGGAGGYPVAVAGAAGGSGIVIIRYKFQ